MAPPYDPVSDLLPVAFVAKVPLVLVVPPICPIKSLQDLVQFARKTPKGLSGTHRPGSAVPSTLIMEALKRELQIDITHVPFRGPIPGLTAVAGGHTQLMLVDVLNAASLVESGKIRPIALTTATELDAFRDVSTFAQAGLNGLDADLRFMLFAPSKVRPDRDAAQLQPARGFRRRGHSRALCQARRPRPADARSATRRSDVSNGGRSLVSLCSKCKLGPHSRYLALTVRQPPSRHSSEQFAATAFGTS